MIIRIRVFKLFFIFIITALFSLTSTAASTPQALDAEIKNLNAVVSNLQVDQPKALTDLLTISNLLNGGLLTAPVVNATSGGTVDLPISIIPSTFSVASLQADLVLPTGILLSSITAGPEATAANKQVTFSGNRFILFGLNQTLLSGGVVAIAHLTVGAKGIFSIGLINPVFSDANGHSVVASTTSGTVISQ